MRNLAPITIEYQKNFTEVAVLFREGVRNFFMVGQSEADITKSFEYLQKYKFLPFLRQIFGGAIAHPAPPLALAPSLVLLRS